MGIPSYFSYIVKNHAKIVRRLEKNKMTVNNFYLDCNSIIYDAVHNIDFTNLTDTDTNVIIRSVILKIEEYISLINPDTKVFIAFDGVAPVAKLSQQRERRYKSLYLGQISKTIFKDTKPDPWNTTAITPGTVFMKKLNEKIRSSFTEPSKYNIKTFIISPSDKPGEGEHKIFEYIRKNTQYHEKTATVIYGLDADLIMLSINHLPISQNIYLFRETPHFIKNISADLEPHENYMIDIPELARIITLDMNNGEEMTTLQEKNRIYDYIFMCFFLGNDFMPHFPSINIRTGGVNKMLNAYKATLGATSDNLTDGKKIYWKNVRKLVSFLCDAEEENFKIEMKSRDRREQGFMPDKTAEEKFKKFDSLPIYERQLEKYINPFKKGWEERYYKELFDIDIRDEERKKQICKEYLEGLEWTMKYYTTGCPDWRWRYSYHYPPLLTDLMHYIPYFDAEFIVSVPMNPVNELVQLCYVLPKQSLHFLPEELYKKLSTNYSHWYKKDCEFIWAFCRYFWESHVLLPDIDIHELECVVNEYALSLSRKNKI